MLAGLNCPASVVIVVQAESIQSDHRVSDNGIVPRLSVESLTSVQDAAIAIRYHGVKYLSVVDDGRLVGIVAFRGKPRQSRRDPGLRSDRHRRDRVAGASGHTKARCSQ